MTLVEKAGKAHKRVEPSKPGSLPAKPLPGPPTVELPVNGTLHELQESDAIALAPDAGKPKSDAERPKQHERRGENVLLKEVVEYLRSQQEAKVCLCTIVF